MLRALIEPRVRAVDIAREAKVTESYVSQILSGRRSASPRIIDACRRLGLPVDSIFGDRDGTAA